MVISFLFLWIEFESHSNVERLEFYLNPDTRPDFPDEVPAGESDWVEAFEFLPAPTSVQRIGNDNIYIYFETETNPDPFDICNAIGLMKPKLLLSLENVEGEDSYETWENGVNKLVYAPSGLDDPDDDEQYNRNLASTDKKQIDLLSDKPQKALAYLADIIRNGQRSRPTAD